MEQGRDFDDGPAGMRRRRKIVKPQRDKTPTVADDDEAFVQNVSMQIRPPGSMSAHESKILRRRDKTFVGVAARSHSQPREAEKLSTPEVYQLLTTVKRSLSSPRHKDESSEGEPYAERRARRYSPAATSEPRTDDDKLTRLEQNLRRFEDERLRFDRDKRKFEREKRDHKVRYKQMMDAEERKKMLENYRKLSDRINLPTDADERRRLIQSLKQSHREVSASPKPRTLHLKPKFVENESSALESSDSEALLSLAEQRRARRERLSSSSSKQQTRSPPPVPERKNLSRHSSLSPIRPHEMDSLQVSAEAALVRRRRSSPKPEDGVPIRRKSPSFTAEDKTDQLDFLKVMRRKSFARADEAERRRSPVRPTSESEEVRRKSIVHSTDEAPLPTEPEIPTQPEVVPKKLDEDSSKEIPEPTATEAIHKPAKKSLFSKVWSVIRSPAIIAKPATRAILRQFLAECSREWHQLKSDYPFEVDQFRVQRNTCIGHMILLILLCGFGGFLFRYTEGASENIYKCEVRKVKRDFIDVLWSQSHNQREDDWKSNARTKLRKFEEELVTYHELAGKTFPGAKSWNFVNSVLYCWTIVTTIGYGHIVPQTDLGRFLTIVYAIIGIPIFLIVLADFGKVFTRGMKFLWAYVRRLYYTGTCRNVRKHQQVRDMLTGINTMYDMAMRRPSMYFAGTEDVEADPNRLGAPGTPQSLGNHLSVHTGSNTETPTSPYPETFEIDDEFNLPISVASTILVLYILIGTVVYNIWEDWGYFESFYFVFISMSTIGFGDFVPNHPIYMMSSILYLIFGLALTSMFINVVQIKLSNTFKDASTKIGATIGLTMAEEAQSQMRTPSPEVTSIHPGKPLSDVTVMSGPQPYGDGAPPPPPLLPKRYISVPAPEDGNEKKKKKGFFKK